MKHWIGFKGERGDVVWEHVGVIRVATSPLAACVSTFWATSSCPLPLLVMLVSCLRCMCVLQMPCATETCERRDAYAYGAGVFFPLLFLTYYAFLIPFTISKLTLNKTEKGCAHLMEDYNFCKMMDSLLLLTENMIICFIVDLCM